MATICKDGLSAFLASIIQRDADKNPTIIILGLMASRRLGSAHVYGSIDQ
jgi:hypothetical protein